MNSNESTTELTTNDVQITNSSNMTTDHEDSSPIVSESTSELYDFAQSLAHNTEYVDDDNDDVFEPEHVSERTAERIIHPGKLTWNIRRMFCCVPIL